MAASNLKKRKANEVPGAPDESDSKEEKPAKKNDWTYPPESVRKFLDEAKQPGKQQKLSVLRAGKLIYYYNGHIYCTQCEKNGVIDFRYKYDPDDKNAVRNRCDLILRCEDFSQSIGNMSNHWATKHLQIMIDKAYDMGRVGVGKSSSLGRC
jgi:hypothetical protein